MQDLPAKLLELAEIELSNALSVLPKDKENRLVIFIEAMRVIDFWSVFQSRYPPEKTLSMQDFEIILLGWNLAIEHLYSEFPRQGFPIKESTQETREFVTSLLHSFGRSAILKKASSLVGYGHLKPTFFDKNITLKTDEIVKMQYLDQAEFERLDDIYGYLKRNTNSAKNGWYLSEFDGLEPSMTSQPGSYIYNRSDTFFEEFRLNEDEVTAIMSDLIFEWDSGYGVMMGYEAEPKLDRHFYTLCVEMAQAWMSYAGLHPSAKLGDISAFDLMLIVASLSSSHIKHIRFALIAMTTNDNISIPQSLTVWKPLDELIESVSAYTKIDIEKVRNVVKAITLDPSDSKYFNQLNSRFIPLLVNLGNGYVLSPVSSLLVNPFLPIITLLSWRNPNTSQSLSKFREDWMRLYLYSQFQGTRYNLVEGNIKIRSNGKIVTDIDAAIFDTLSGELALFQIKWQDYYTHDIKKLRSKAKNFTTEVDEWAVKVQTWIDENGIDGLVKSLRLKIPKSMTVQSIYLFGLSRTTARMQGYGYQSNNENIAICNLPQFLRLRFEIGSVGRVFHEIFNKINGDIEEPVTVSSLPFTITVDNISITFEDFMNTYESKKQV